MNFPPIEESIGGMIEKGSRIQLGSWMILHTGGMT